MYKSSHKNSSDPPRRKSDVQSSSASTTDKTDDTAANSPLPDISAELDMLPDELDGMDAIDNDDNDSLFADDDEVFGIMRVASGVTIAVVDLDKLAEAVSIRRPGHDAISNCDDFRTVLASEIHAAMLGGLAGERIRAFAEVG